VRRLARQPSAQARGAAMRTAGMIHPAAFHPLAAAGLIIGNSDFANPSSPARLSC
jgi:hypothetical protein